MAKLIEVDLHTWYQQYLQTEIQGKLPATKPFENTFGHLQWAGRDTLLQAERKYWALEVEGEKVAFVSSYFVSKRVIRMRTFMTREPYRGRGYLKRLFEMVKEHYQGRADWILCFCGPKERDIYYKLGFQDEKNFKPRAPEYFDDESGHWIEAQAELYLLKRAVDTD